MTGRKANFGWPHQIRGNKVATRFNLRSPETGAPIKKEASIFSYAQAGRGQAGESGRMGQGGSSF